MSRAMSMKHIGSLVGGLLVGAFMDRFRERTNLVVAISLLVCGTGTMVQPWSTYLEAYAFLFVLEGVCQGTIDTCEVIP
jgi:MFS family permease